MLKNLVQEKYSMQTQAHGHYLETLKVPVLFDCMFCSRQHICLGCNPSVHTHTRTIPRHKWWFDIGQTWKNPTWKVDLYYLGTLPILRICCGSDIVEAWRIFVRGIRSRAKPSTFAGHFAKKGSMQIQQSNIEWYQILRHVECYA